MATCSPARLKANQLNALKSTGPKSLEGKAASRLNAFQHGMAGQGDLAAPGEDLALVARRAAALASELGATGDSGQILAHRAALLSIRMERLAERDLQAVAADVAAARVQFDRDWLDDLTRWVGDLEGENARSAVDSLEQSPDGLAQLKNAWKQVRDVISGVNELGSTYQAEQRAALWLGLTEAEADELDDDDYLPRIDAEVARLDRLAESPLMAHFNRVLTLARDEAGRLASFNPSPEATLARRYEAAAERGMYRAFRAIGELNRAATNRSQADLELPNLAPTPSPLALPAASAPASSQPANLTPLASFRAEVFTPVSPASKLVGPATNRSTSTPEDRKKRPDPNKLARKLALAHR